MPDHQPAAAAEDPNFVPGAQTSYGAHYCNVPREKDPVIAACSFLNSGLRIFDIRDPEHPKETAYFVSPPGTAQGQQSDAAFSQPAFDPKRREVATSPTRRRASGTCSLNDRAWPRDATRRRSRPPTAAPLRLPPPLPDPHPRAAPRAHRERPRNAARQAPAHPPPRTAGSSPSSTSAGGPRRTFVVRIRVRTTAGRTYDDSRRYHPCVRKHR